MSERPTNEAPVEQDTTEAPVEKDTTVATVGAPARPQPLALFALALVLVVLSLGTPILLMARNAMSTETPTDIATAAPEATPASRTATAAPAPVRVVSAAGTSEPAGGGTYRVVFAWILEGAREGDSAVVRFSAGSRVISESRGALDANVFESRTGRLTLATEQACSTDGWIAEIVTIRGAAPTGDAAARAAGARCS